MTKNLQSFQQEIIAAGVKLPGLNRGGNPRLFPLEFHPFGRMFAGRKIT